MGFWTRKQDGAPSSQGRTNPSDLEKLRKNTSQSAGPGTYSGRDLTTKSMRRSRATSIPQPPRSQTVPVLSESKSTQNVRAGGKKNGADLYLHRSTSQASFDHENLPEFHGPPTLFAKRSNTGVQSPRPRTKRKTDEYEREREIRAMTSEPIPIPKRPNNYRSESPLLREKRLVSSGLKRQSSEISLPLPGSMADIDFSTAQNSFKIGLLAALSPRPNIQYDSQARTASAKQPLRTGVAIQNAIEEEDVSELRRIDELADDLDAGGLRELMERDRKRREKKKELDKEKLLRRLERRALKDREEETRRARTEAFVRESSPANLERRTGRKTDPLGSRPKSSSKTALKQSSAAGQAKASQFTKKAEVPPKEPKDEKAAVDKTDTSKVGYSVVAETGKSPFLDDAAIIKPASPDIIRNPFEDEPEVDLKLSFDMSGDEEFVDLPTRSPLRPTGDKLVPVAAAAEPTVSTPTSPPPPAGVRTSLSQRSFSAFSRSGRSDKANESKQEATQSDRKAVRMSTWTNFFSKGTRRKLAAPGQMRTQETDFAITSRESLQRKQLPPVITDRTFQRSDSSTPRRTMSKFREDLPEIPVSTPGGAAAQSATSIATPVRILDVSQHRITHDDEDDDGSSIQHSIDLETYPASTAAEPLPVTMASVDSEGSWLSGRPSQRVSGRGNTAERSLSSLQRTGTRDGTAQEDSRRSADYDFQDRTDLVSNEHRPSASRKERTVSNEQIGPEGEGQAPPPALPAKSDKRESVRADARRRPTIVNQGDRIQSHAGLLNNDPVGIASKPEINNDFVDEDEIESPGSVEIIDAPLMRAQSVEYKGHARAVSAGSAKLLDIKRSSTHSDLGRPRSPTVARKSALGLSQQDDSIPGTPTTVD